MSSFGTEASHSIFWSALSKLLNFHSIFDTRFFASDMNRIIFRQLFEKESSTYTYLLACRKTKKAVLIDPVLETVDRDTRVIKQLGLDLVYGQRVISSTDDANSLLTVYPSKQGPVSCLCNNYPQKGWIHMFTLTISLELIDFGSSSQIWSLV